MSKDTNGINQGGLKHFAPNLRACGGNAVLCYQQKVLSYYPTIENILRVHKLQTFDTQIFVKFNQICKD